jgi:hypothetical protein
VIEAEGSQNVELLPLRTSEAIRSGSGTIQIRSRCGGHQSNFEKAHESKALLRLEQSEEEPVGCASSGQE